MSKAVRVTTLNGSPVVVPSKNNPEFGYIRVEQIVPKFSGKWATPEKRSALIAGKVEDLRAMGFTAGQELPGKIVINESLEGSENEKKIAGATGIVCSVGGQAIFRSAMYTEEAGASDSLITHDNQEEIKFAQEKLKADEANL